MFRLIRVILTAEVSRFTGGLGQATHALGGFVGAIRSGIAGAMRFVNDLVNTIAHLPDAFTAVTDAIEGLFGPALARERFTALFTSLTGNAGQASDMMTFLRDKSLELGIGLEGLLPAAQQVTVALRGMDGEVDPAMWEELTMAIIKFSQLRPDVPMQLWGRAISGLLAGDVSTLTRLLDIDVRQMGQLSQEVQAFLNSTGEARDEQLGRVTRIAGETASDRDTALQALREILEATGATDDMLQTTADTTQGKLNRLKAQWEDFVARVGLELLPLLEEALDDLLVWLEEHAPEIEAFIQEIGDVATELYDKFKTIDWAAVGDELAKAGEIAGQAWEWIKEVAEALGILGDSGGETGGGSSFGPGASGGGAPVESGGAAVLTGPQWQGWDHFWEDFTTNFQNIVSGATPLEITVGVDPKNGTIEPYVKQTVDKSMEEMADHITGLRGGH